MEKDIAYHALKDSMEGGACPICAQTAHAVRQAMKSILYESMTDMDIRNAIKDARGFCRYHTEMFSEEGDPLTNAIVYGDVLRSALHDVVYDRFHYYENRKTCYFCEMAKETEATYSKACHEALHEEEFFKAYKKGGLLCMPHLHAMELLSEANKESTEFFQKLAQATVDKYQVLIRELDEVQRKSDYRNAKETWTEGEKTAGKRAVKVVHDQVGIPREEKKAKFCFFKRK